MKKCTQIDKVRSTNKNFPQIDRVRSTINSMSEINKPLVSILLAVYKPNEQWLIEQLISLNEQNYPNLDLLIYDDCPEYPVDEKLFDKYITNFKYEIIRGTLNKGSNKAFEELTKRAKGEYFAYCDQDDIWEKNKISVMMDKFKEKDVNLVCCDLCIINENGIKTHESITDIRKRIIYKSGYGLAEGLLISNFVTGCAMIVKRNIALKAVPFPNEMIHDNWIAVIAALDGKITYVDDKLIRYRQHSNNQTGILKGIKNKETYYNIKIVELLNRYIMLKKRLKNNELKEYIDYCIVSLEARRLYFKKPSFKQLIIILKHSKYYKASILLEIFSPIIPEFVFEYIINLTKKGIL